MTRWTGIGAFLAATLVSCALLAAEKPVEQPPKTPEEIWAGKVTKLLTRAVHIWSIVYRQIEAEPDMSVFLNMMLCGEKLHILRDAKNKRSLLEQKPWLVRLPAYLRE